MGFLWLRYRLQTLAHLSLSHSLSFTHTQPLCSHNTAMDPVKGPRFIFLCTGDVSIENTSCVWGRKLARQQRTLYTADTIERGSQWRPAEPVAHNGGLQRVGQIHCNRKTSTSTAEEIPASHLAVTQMFKLYKDVKRCEKCAAVYKYRAWLLLFPPTSRLKPSVRLRSVRRIQTTTVSQVCSWVVSIFNHRTSKVSFFLCL